MHSAYVVTLVPVSKNIYHKQTTEFCGLDPRKVLECRVLLRVNQGNNNPIVKILSCLDFDFVGHVMVTIWVFVFSSYACFALNNLWLLTSELVGYGRPRRNVNI